MTKQQKPPGYGYNSWEYIVPLTPEGFATIDVVEMLSHCGWSKRLARQLIKDGSVKIQDTFISNKPFTYEWRYRPVGEIEVAVEDMDIFRVGKWKFIHIKGDIPQQTLSLRERVVIELGDIFKYWLERRHNKIGR